MIPETKQFSQYGRTVKPEELAEMYAQAMIGSLSWLEQKVWKGELGGNIDVGKSCRSDTREL